MRKLVFSALLGTGSLMVVMLPASAEEAMTLKTQATAAAVGPGQRIITWACAASSTDAGTMAMGMAHCDVTYNGATSHALEPVVVSGKAVANGSTVIVQTAAVTTYTVCMEATAYITFVGAVTQSQCDTYPIG